MPTSSQFNIIRIIESKKRLAAWAAVALGHADERSVSHESHDETVRYETTTDYQTAVNGTYHEGNLRPCCNYAKESTRPCSGSEAYPTVTPAKKVNFYTPDSEVSEASSVPNDEEAMAPEATRSDIDDDSKQRLYGLGFRDLPGGSVTQRDDLDTVLKHRPGIRIKKPNVNSIEEKKKEEVPVVIHGITECTPTVDISTINPALLKPTALCFDATYLDITHQQLKKALDKVLQYCDGAKIETIQYENRRLLDETLPNRWMLYADSQESRDNICGRQVVFGGRVAVLRRYDDLVILAHKRALRAQAWKNVLGSK